MVNTVEITYSLKPPDESDRKAATLYSREVEPEASYCLGGMGFDAWLHLIQCNRHDIQFIYDDNVIVGTVENRKRFCISNSYQLEAHHIEQVVRRIIHDIN